MNEDDTYRKLKRLPFDDVLELLYNRPGSSGHWSDLIESTGWNKDEWEAECRMQLEHTQRKMSRYGK